MEQPAKCARCGSETRLYNCDVPICVKCDEARTKVIVKKRLAGDNETSSMMTTDNEKGNLESGPTSLSREEFACLEVGAMVYLDGDRNNWYTVTVETAGYLAISDGKSILSYPRRRYSSL
jgi:hypothetical protein